MPDDEDEVISEEKTMVRRSGDVDVVTIPASVAKLNAVKRQKGKWHPILVIRRAGKYLIEFQLEEEPLEP